MVGEGRCDLGQHARAVGHVEADVVAGQGLPHGEDGQVGIGALSGATAAADAVATDRDDVAEDGRCRRVTTRALAVEHQLPRGVGVDEDRVERLAHAGQRVRSRDHRRVHAHRDPRGAVACVDLLADREQLDDTVHLACGCDVGSRDVGDPLAVHVLAGDPRVEGQRGQDRSLRRGIETLDVGRRVGLGVAQSLRLGDRVVEAGPRGVHLVEHVVGRAVDDADDLAHVVTGQGLAQRAQQRDRPGDGGLVVEVDLVLLGRGIQRRAVLGEQRLVGGDDGGAVLHRPQDQAAGGLDATDHLDDDVGARDQVVRVGGEQGRVDTRGTAVTAGPAHGDADDLERAPHTGGEVVAVLGEEPRDR